MITEKTPNHKRGGRKTKLEQVLIDTRNMTILRRFLDGVKQRDIAVEQGISDRAVNQILVRISFKLLNDEVIKIMKPTAIREKYKDELLQKITLSV
jgi:DNA-binding NarL/FixJ family response regulator